MSFDMEYYNRFPTVLKNALINGTVKFPDSLQYEYEDLVVYRGVSYSKNKTTIDKQFEYNTYIRDFFEDNKNKSLEHAIKCWKYKKSLKGHNKYEREDLKALYK